MASDSAKEIQELLRSLPDGVDPADVVVISNDPEALVTALAERVPGASLRVMASSALDLPLADALLPELRGRITVSVDPPPPGSADLAVIRVTGFEGKDRLRARMALAREALRPGRDLFIVSHARRGADSNLKMMAELLDDTAVVGRGSGGVRILHGVRGAGSAALEPGRADEQVLDETVLGEHFVFRTGESVFSRGRLDLGTRLLLETMDLRGARRLLDLGCGYGPIGIVLARVWPELVATLVDVDVEAVRLAQENAGLNGVDDRIRVVLSDGLRGLAPGESFDVVLTHFPLHIPRNELVRILTEAHNALEPGGRLCGVALSVYDVRASVRQAFGNVETIAETSADNYPHAFRVVCAERR